MITPKEHYEATVRVAYEDWLNDKTNQYRANAFASACYDFVEWTFQYYKAKAPERLGDDKTLTKFRRKVNSACPHFAIIRNLSDAKKHRFIDQDVVIIAGGSSTAAYVEKDGSLYLPSVDENLADIAEQMINYLKTMF